MSPPGRAGGLRRESGVGATLAPPGARRDCALLEGDGSLTTAVGAVRKLLLFDSDSRMAIGNSAGLRYLGDPISIEKMVGRWAGNRAGWKPSPALMGRLTFFGMKVPDRALEHAWSIGRMSAS